ncbi:MAG: hypothetical protein ACOCP8_06345 [archaeon]
MSSEENIDKILNIICSLAYYNNYDKKELLEFLLKNNVVKDRVDDNKVKGINYMIPSSNITIDQFYNWNKQELRKVFKD